VDLPASPALRRQLRQSRRVLAARPRFDVAARVGWKGAQRKRSSRTESHRDERSAMRAAFGLLVARIFTGSMYMIFFLWIHIHVLVLYMHAHTWEGAYSFGGPGRAPLPPGRAWIAATSIIVHVLGV